MWGLIRYKPKCKRIIKGCKKLKKYIDILAYLK